MSGQAKLYTPELLACAVQLAEYPFASGFATEADARSATCGSTLRLGVDCDDEGRISALGLRAQACAVGQAAASIFAQSARGQTATDIARAADEIRFWLTDPEAPQPDWPRIDLLAPARSYPGRHGAILLAWDAAVRALSNPPRGG